jgi:hypothetical protein
MILDLGNTQTGCTLNVIIKLMSMALKSIPLHLKVLNTEREYLKSKFLFSSSSWVLIFYFEVEHVLR